ncbi:hypothetical protein [Acidianus sp. HS-5]|uniref:hypothetical protein n=1 Tax=Acidianus sp. HS-5 TaxID=2886040 RepID=UPI001F1C353F|nr:hypothetical protein [Acidianus sp. HS-5]BDC18268.1 hypothetical protein HS5_11580 [Acidianus sp. HS-5]
MIVDIKIEWHKVKELKIPYIYWRDVIVVLRTIDKVIYVTACKDELSKFKPPLQARNFDYYYQIGKLESDEDIRYLDCVALELQKKLRPYITNKIECKEEAMISLQSM